MRIAERRPWRRRGRRPASAERRPPPASRRPLPALPTAAGYAVGGGLAAFAFGAESLLLPVFQFSTFLLFYPGSFVTALVAGTGPALFNLALAGAGTMWLLTQRQPAGEAPLLAAVHTVAFLAFSGAAASLAGRLRRVETELRHSEEDLRRAQEVARLGSWRLDMARDELVWSEETFKLFEVPLGARLTYADFIGSVHPEDRRRVDEAWQAALRGAPYDLEHRIIVNGRALWVHERAELEFDASGKPLSGVGTVQDITERKRVEEDLVRLREMERFRAALETAAGGMVVVRFDGTIVWVNSEVERLSGWTREELAGLSVETLIPERERAAVADLRRAFAASGVVKKVASAERDLFLLSKDGAEIPVEVILTRVRQDGGEFEVASLTDITLRKKAEAERDRMFEAIRLAKEQAETDLAAMTRLQSIALMSLEQGSLAPVLEQIVETAIAISGADFGNIQVLDQATLDLVIAAHRGFPQWWLDFWNRVAKGHGTCGTALARGERVIVEDVAKSPVFAGTPALEIQLRAGVRAVQSTPLVSRSGKPLGMFSTHYKTPRRPGERALRMLDLLARQAADIIEQAQTSEALRGTVLDLESFAYTISHDLRSPLRAIQGYAHFLYERLAASADSDSRRMLSRMEHAALRLDVLIKDLLAFNSVSRQEVALQPVDLDETLAHVTDHYPELARAELRVRAPLGKASAQPSLAIQVLANLLVNAVKFVPPERKPRIEVSAQRRGGKVALSIGDNGIGIPREALPRLFKPFERLHRAADYPGTGMGLAIVKRAVERMGGTVAVESQPGKGSVFTVTLTEA